jgi:hypothetical protein
MDGKQQAQALAKLASTAKLDHDPNSDHEQNVEHAQHWQPDQLAGFRIGDAVRLPNLDCTFEVIGFDNSLLTLRSPSGREIKAGWRVASKVRQR